MPKPKPKLHKPIMRKIEMRNERTSKRVAKIAGRILGANLAPENCALFFQRNGLVFTIYARDITAMAASLVTQAPDKSPPKPKRKR